MSGKCWIEVKTYEHSHNKAYMYGKLILYFFYFRNFFLVKNRVFRVGSIKYWKCKKHMGFGFRILEQKFLLLRDLSEAFDMRINSPPVYDNSMELFWVEGGWAWEGVRDHTVSDNRYMYQTRDHIVWFINDRKLICATFDLSKSTATSVEVIGGSDWLSPEHDRKRWRIVCVKRRCPLSGLYLFSYLKYQIWIQCVIIWETIILAQNDMDDIFFE